MKSRSSSSRVVSSGMEPNPRERVGKSVISTIFAVPIFHHAHHSGQGGRKHRTGAQALQEEVRSHQNRSHAACPEGVREAEDGSSRGDEESRLQKQEGIDGLIIWP